MKKLIFVLKLMSFIFICITIGILGLYTYAYVSPSLNIKDLGSFYIYDANDNIIYQGSKKSEWISLDEISTYVKTASVSVEDKNFYNHKGFDILRIIKALYNNLENKRIVEGASTISQQYIKNVYLTFDKSWKRKIKEAFLTIKLETHYNKEEILEGYLNTINYGQGNYGIEAASQFYFNKKASDLNLEESLMLVGIPKNPSNYNPIKDYDTCIKRAKIVAQTMLNNNLLTEEEYNNLFKEKITIYGKRTENNLQMLMYYQDAVLEELETKTNISEKTIEKGGLKIHTALNLEAQKTLEENTLKYLPNNDLQVASIITNPKTGAIIALTGGLDYTKSQYNRALYSKRQVGSTMKTFLYYAALENNMTMASTFTSEETTFNLENNVIYKPANYASKYANKKISMAAALAFSDNIYAVKTNLFIGVDKMIDVAHKTGIKEDLQEVASLALGTNEINIMDYATGYNTFASGGYQNELYLIEYIEDSEGNIIYKHEDESKLVLNPNYVYILNELLTCTTNTIFIDYTTATGLSIASKLTRKYALKSGTTNTDYFIAGYTPDLMMLMWTGYDDNSELDAKTGNSVKNIWADTMESLLKDKETNWYEKPDNVIGLSLNAISGQAENNIDKNIIYYFVKGTENYNNN